MIYIYIAGCSVTKLKTILFSKRTFFFLFCHGRVRYSRVWRELCGRNCLRKELTFGDATIGFLAKRRLRNERRNSILMTVCVTTKILTLFEIGWIEANSQPIRSTKQIWVVTRHQYGISLLVSQTSFRRETSGGVAKCRLFSQATVESIKTFWY